MSLFVALELVALPPVWFAIAQQVDYLLSDGGHL
jgi:hypothetical protein